MTVLASQVLGVLLGGGRSQRMGNEDKCLSLLAGRPLLEYAIDRLRPQVGALVLNANGAPDRFASFGLPVIADTVPGYLGPLAGFLAGMRWADVHMADARFIATVATDTPFFPLDLVAELSAAIDTQHDVAVARSAGRDYPVFGLFPVALVDDLDTYLKTGDNRAVMAWLDHQRTAFVDFSPTSDNTYDPFFNINTTADLAVAESALRAKSSRPASDGQ